MSLEKETKNYFGQVRNRDKNSHKREDHPKRMNEEPTRHPRRLVTDDHVSEINL